MSETLRVEFAYPYTDRAGRNHNADASAALPLEEAKHLIHFGRARVAKEEPAPKAPAPKKAPAKRPAAPKASTANASKEK